MLHLCLPRCDGSYGKARLNILGSFPSRENNFFLAFGWLLSYDIGLKVFAVLLHIHVVINCHGNREEEDTLFPLECMQVPVTIQEHLKMKISLKD